MDEIYSISGSYFGEIGCLMGGVRRAGVKALCTCELQALSKRKLNIILAEYPGVVDELKSIAEKRTRETEHRLKFKQMKMKSKYKKGSSDDLKLLEKEDGSVTITKDGNAYELDSCKKKYDIGQSKKIQKDALSSEQELNKIQVGQEHLFQTNKTGMKSSPNSDNLEGGQASNEFCNEDVLKKRKGKMFDETCDLDLFFGTLRYVERYSYFFILL